MHTTLTNNPGKFYNEILSRFSEIAVFTRGHFSHTLYIIELFVTLYYIFFCSYRCNLVIFAHVYRVVSVDVLMC